MHLNRWSIFCGSQVSIKLHLESHKNSIQLFYGQKRLCRSCFSLWLRPLWVTDVAGAMAQDVNCLSRVLPLRCTSSLHGLSGPSGFKVFCGTFPSSTSGSCLRPRCGNLSLSFDLHLWAIDYFLYCCFFFLFQRIFIVMSQGRVRWVIDLTPRLFFFLMIR